MATLTPVHNKIPPLRFPSYLFSQLLDVVERAGTATEDSNIPSVRRGLFFRQDIADEFSDRIQVLLDEEKFLVATFPSIWWVTEVARVLTINSATEADVAAYVNDPEYRHFYFGFEDTISQIDEEDISFEPISNGFEKRLADLSAFMKMSDGFWLHWT